MRSSPKPWALALGLLAGLLLLAAGTAQADSVQRMTCKELADRLGEPGLVVLDVRTTAEWKESDNKIRGALREDPDETDTWAKNYDPAKVYVLYCS